jgi:hypothetical protein
MRRWLALLIVLAAGVEGCASRPVERSTARLHAPPAGPVGDDVIYLDVAVIERPAGDPFLNAELWMEADEQAVRADGDDEAITLERKTVLEKNGFRVGQVVGQLPPARLQELLLSARSCQANRIQLHAGHDTTIPVGPPRPRCLCCLDRGGQRTDAEWQKAQCLLEITPTLVEGGRIRLHCTPHVKHGELKLAFTPLRDADGVLRWGRRELQPEEVYPWLSWTLTVAPNEYVVIGTQLDNGDTLGEQFFVSGDESANVQRLLVLRTAHVPTPGGPGDKPNRVPPLALRASLTAARGQGE